MANGTGRWSLNKQPGGVDTSKGGRGPGSASATGTLTTTSGSQYNPVNNPCQIYGPYHPACKHEKGEEQDKWWTSGQDKKPPAPSYSPPTYKAPAAPKGPDYAKLKGEAAGYAKKQRESQEKALEAQMKNLSIMTAQALGLAETGAVGAGLGLDEAQRKYGVSGGMALAEQSNLQAQVAGELSHLYGQEALAKTDIQGQIDMLESQEDLWALDYYSQLLGLEQQKAGLSSQYASIAASQRAASEAQFQRELDAYNKKFIMDLMGGGGFAGMEGILGMYDQIYGNQGGMGGFN